MELLTLPVGDLQWLSSWEPAPARQQEIINLLNELIGIEATMTDMEADGQFYRYRAYPMYKFCKLLNTAREAARAKQEAGEHFGAMSMPLAFLEIGCGPGTKLVAANQVFCMDADGIDRDVEYVAAAQDLVELHGVSASVALLDAMKDVGAEDYRTYDIVFLNRPIVDYEAEVALEQFVCESMAKHAVLMLGNGLTVPPGWKLVAQDVMCQVWVKTCRCDDLENLLVRPGTDHEDYATLLCQQCDRVFVVNGDTPEEART